MAKLLLLKHYRGNPIQVVDFDPMDRWAPTEIDALMKYMNDFAAGSDPYQLNAGKLCG